MKKDLFFDFILIIGLLFISACGIFRLLEERTDNRNEYENKLEYCFKQEPRTKDCEFVLWKYEHK